MVDGMKCGAEFEEDVFERLSEKRAFSNIRQGATVYLPEDPDKMDSENKDGIHRCLRHKADYQFYHKDYSKASETYERILRLLPPSSGLCRSECMENLSRSFLHMGHSEKALEWALKMHETAVDTDQEIVSLSLLATVCHSLEKYEEELEALHSCLDPHRCSPELWFRLACCYAGMFKIDLPHSKCKQQEQTHCCAFRSRVANSAHCHNTTKDCNGESVQSAIVADDSNNVANLATACSKLEQASLSQQTVDKCEVCALGVQMISACLLRARLMCSSEKSHLLSEKFKRMNEKITDCLNHMEVDQVFIDEASKMLMSEILSGQPAAKDDKSLPPT